MPWPLIKLIPMKTNLKFVRFAFFASFVSIALVIASFVSMFTAGFRETPMALYAAASGTPTERLGQVLSQGFNLGIDFKGGTQMEIASPAEIDGGRLGAGLEGLGIGEVQVQAFAAAKPGEENRALLRFESTDQEHLAAVTARLPQLIPGLRIVGADVVGPKVSGELFVSGLIALGLAMVMVMVYIWARFGMQFGFGAVLSLFHDTILTLGLFSVARIDFTLPIIAALLTVIGYSMNDTVVVFDRMRTNFRKYKKMPAGQVIDLSINETLSRTLVTSVTALLASIALYLFGGRTLEGFAICMIFGIILATYSSIYIAAPALPLVKPARVGGAGEAPDPSMP